MFGDRRLPERFWNKVVPEPNTGCWLWEAGTNWGGYGRFQVDGKSVGVHRYIYQKLVKTVPRGRHIDHLCRVRCCVNPDHLEDVTAQENIQRGANWNSRKTHCKHGHSFDKRNTYYDPQGYRHCRTCGRERWRRHKVVG